MRIINWLKETGLTVLVSASQAGLDNCLTRAAGYQAEGNYRSALAACDQALLIDPNSATAYYIRGLARYALDDLDGALGDWKKSDALKRQLH